MITTIQLIATILYVGIVIKKFGILTSISASSYRWEGNYRWLFFGWLWLVGVLNLFQGFGGWGFLTSMGLIYAGITIDHSSKGAHTNIVHVVGTVSAIAGVFIGLLVVHGMLLPMVVFGIISILLLKVPNTIWWIESVAFIIAFIAYYLR